MPSKITFKNSIFTMEFILHICITKTLSMIIVVNHKISNPSEFWAAAERNLPLLPASGVKRIIQVLPNKDKTEATCVWEAETIAALDVYLRRKVFDWSTDTYFELNLAETIGLIV